MPTKVLQKALPEVLEIADLDFVINEEDKQSATRHAELLFAEFKGVFYGRYPALAMLYELDIEIVSTRQASWKFVGRVRLKLRKNWKSLEKKSKTIYAVAATAVAAVVGYPDFREGVIEISKDAKSGWEWVVDRKSESEPGMITSADFRPIPPHNGKPGEEHQRRGHKD